ncbi:MAG: hypothetical protein JW809_17005 [Pirellulales bacterium]|nr:hypothetical protein [Pirellulales bacterium]
MLKILAALNHVLGTALVLLLLGLVALGGWFGYRAYDARRQSAEEAQRQLEQRDARIHDLAQQLREGQAEIARLGDDLATTQKENRRLQADLQKRLREIQQLQTAIRLLKVDHRIARIHVISRQGTAEAGDLITKVGFVEVDEQGQPLDAMRVFNLAGDVVYVDAWVVKFTDQSVERGDPLRSTSICLFRRLFGESQQPKDGFELDAVGSRPAAYGLGKNVSPNEQELWTRFWELANDPAAAKQAGVRAAHGEAPSIKLLPGRSYKVLLRASGGLSIAAEEPPVSPPTL